MLKDKTSLFKRARNAYFLKFRYIDLAIGGDIYFKFLGGSTKIS